MKQRVPWRAIGKAARNEIREWRRVELKIISVSSNSLVFTICTHLASRGLGRHFGWRQCYHWFIRRFGSCGG